MGASTRVPIRRSLVIGGIPRQRTRVVREGSASRRSGSVMEDPQESEIDRVGCSSASNDLLLSNSTSLRLPHRSCSQAIVAGSLESDPPSRQRIGDRTVSQAVKSSVSLNRRSPWASEPPEDRNLISLALLLRDIASSATSKLSGVLECEKVSDAGEVQ
jgi:hypothetical protein